jgi:hypothetical protein
MAISAFLEQNGDKLSTDNAKLYAELDNHRAALD